MVKINTRDFGEIEINEDRIFHFPNGVFAFEDSKHFALISPLGDDIYPMWLQSTEDTTPCFIVFDPSLIDAAYRVTLSKGEKSLLRLGDSSPTRYLSIAKVPADYRDTTVNMKSPIIINTELKIATQVILPTDYEFRLPIYRKDELEEGVS